jgi:hypothetical protein
MAKEEVTVSTLTLDHCERVMHSHFRTTQPRQTRRKVEVSRRAQSPLIEEDVRQMAA